MRLEYSKEIDDLLCSGRLHEIAERLEQLQDEKTELIGEAMSISEEIGENFACDDFDVYELKDIGIGFYKDLVPIEYIKAVYKKDMLRVSFKFSKKDFTERQIDFIKEIIFSSIMLSRIKRMPVVDFQYEWMPDIYISGFCFDADVSVRNMYIKLQEKGTISFCENLRFYIADQIFDFLEIPE